MTRSVPDDEPLRWAGDWEPQRFNWAQVERATFLAVQVHNLLSVRSIDHSQSGLFDPRARKEFEWKIAHAQDVRPNAMTIYNLWPHFLPGTRRLDVAINLQRAFESAMYFKTDFREWPVICHLMRTGIPRADEHRKQRCDAQVVFEADKKLWSYRFKDEKIRELTCLI